MDRLGHSFVSILMRESELHRTWRLGALARYLRQTLLLQPGGASECALQFWSGHTDSDF